MPLSSPRKPCTDIQTIVPEDGFVALGAYASDWIFRDALNYSSLLNLAILRRATCMYVSISFLHRSLDAEKSDLCIELLSFVD